MKREVVHRVTSMSRLIKYVLTSDILNLEETEKSFVTYRTSKKKERWRNKHKSHNKIIHSTLTPLLELIIKKK